MSETYDFPDAAKVPKVVTATDDPYEQPEMKHLFITYNSDEWESEEDALKCIETMNMLFGTEVQIALMPKDFDLLSSAEVNEMIQSLDD